MSKKLRELQDRKAKVAATMRELNDKVGGENRAMTDEEQSQWQAAKADISDLDAQIAREQEMVALEASMPPRGSEPRQSQAPPARQPSASAIMLSPASHIEVSENRHDDPRGGFRSFGEFAQSVVAAGLPGGRGRFDERLVAAPSTAGNEAAGADGGFVVPPEYSGQVFSLSLGEDAFIPMTDNVDVMGNSMVFPKTEQTPWGSNGVRAYWQVEASAATATKVVLGTQALRLHKLMALVPLTDELVADTSALGQLIPGLIGDSIRWKTNEALLNGNGNGQPMGALISTGPAIVQAKDAAQATNTLSTLNLFNMVSRMPPGSYSRAVWLIHPTVIPFLAGLVIGQVPVFLPAAPPVNGALTQSPNFGYILGRPCFISHHCSTFSSQGDVQLHDFKFYRTITKADGVQMAQSLHLYFDADAVALRATFRVDGGPKIAAAINPAKGSTTLSPFVQLQAR